MAGCAIPASSAGHAYAGAKVDAKLTFTPDHSVGADHEMRDGRPILFRLPQVNFNDDTAGKPVGINEQIGR